ncbi:hypothetical protein [Rhodococcus opacus]|nr:hypothetical protein [Rhodococcus opacus]
MTMRRVKSNVFSSLRSQKVVQAVDLLREFLAEDLADHAALRRRHPSLTTQDVPQAAESHMHTFSARTERASHPASGTKWSPSSTCARRVTG